MMNQGPSRHPMTLAPVCERLPQMETIEPRRGLVFPDAAGQPQTFDLYLPAGVDALEGTPVVVLVNGYPEPQMEAVLGCRFGQMQQSIDWARLIAASGLAAICYANREPAGDLLALLRWLTPRAGAVGLWACSGHGPLAVHVLSQAGDVDLRCAALCYAYTLDLESGTAVRQAAEQFGFVVPEPTPTAVLPARADRGALPSIVLVRAGRDEMPGLNDAMGRFADYARRRGHALELHDLPDSPHAFDLYDDSALSRRAIRRILEFLGECLVPAKGIDDSTSEGGP